MLFVVWFLFFFFFQAEDGIRDRSPSRGLGDVYKRQVYISGEEAVAQVRLRAERLGLADAPVQLAAETSVEDIVSTLSEGSVPRLIVIDSIQTMWTDTVESAPGTVTQA